MNKFIFRMKKLISIMRLVYKIADDLGIIEAIIKLVSGSYKGKYEKL